MFDCGGGDEHNRIFAMPQPTAWSGTSDAALGFPASQIVAFEAAAFHQEKLPLYGGVHPSGTPVRPPDGRSFNVAFADGHVKIFRLGFLQPSWNVNHDMNWFVGSPGNSNLTTDFDTQ